MNKWISVKERLPEPGQKCVIYSGNYYYASYEPYKDDKRYQVGPWLFTICPCCEWIDGDGVTYWQPLQEIPRD